MKKYQVVMEFDTRMLTKEELLSQFQQTGESERGGFLRPELQGEPILKGFAGPMWGGKSEFNEPIVRYESYAAYAILSCD